MHRLTPWLLAWSGGDRLTDLAVYPLVALLMSLGGLIYLPLNNFHSRRLEREADEFALAALPNGAVFESLMKRLAEQNLADPEPDPWIEFIFYSHPSLPNRLRAARKILNAAA